jgi:hypothetical protein
VSDHIPDVTKMIGETPRTDAAYFKPHATMYDLAGEMKLMERELNAANSKIEALNRGNANAERILCEAAGVGSGRDVLEWIVSAKERIKLLEHGIAKQNLEIEQTCGRVLDYPWFKDDEKNFPGATEKDGVCVGEHVAETIAAELALKYTEAKQRIKRLEEAGDRAIENSYYPDRVKVWNKSKEAKP